MHPNFLEQYSFFVERGNFTNNKRDREFLGAMGLSGESGEVSELFKKYLIHGKPLDMEKLKLELGDVFWYFNLILNTYGLDLLNDIVRPNVQKLCDRYPDQYGTPSDWLSE